MESINQIWSLIDPSTLNTSLLLTITYGILLAFLIRFFAVTTMRIIDSVHKHYFKSLSMKIVKNKVKE